MMHGSAARKPEVMVRLEADDVELSMPPKRPLQASVPAERLLCLMGLFWGALLRLASAHTVAAAMMPRQARGPSVALLC